MSFNLNIGPVVNSNAYLSDILQPYNTHLRVAHLNCNSIRPSSRTTKFDEISCVLRGSAFDVIGISETWLKEEVSTSAVNFKDYGFCRNDRVGCRGGGVGIYISDKIQYKVVFKTSVLNKCESLFVELSSGNNKYLFGVVYLPPPADLQAFEMLHSELFLNYTSTIIVGDFNLNLFDVFKSELLRSFCARTNLSICHNSKPTHYDVRHLSTSLIDFFLVSDRSAVAFSGQVQCPSISHHALIFAAFSFGVANNEIVVTHRNYNQINWDGIASYMSTYDDSFFWRSVDVEDKCLILTSLLSDLFTFVPVRRAISSTDNGWMRSREIVLSRSLRDMAFRTYKRDPTTVNWGIFCRYRNKAKRIIRREKRRHFVKLFRGLDNSGMWKVLKGAGCLSSDGMAFNGDANIVNEFFVTGVNSVGRSSINWENISEVGAFSFRCVDEAELLDALNKVKSNSIGVDGIPIRFIKIIYPIISRFVLNFVNSILTTSVFPAAWKSARVVPIPKSGTIRGMEDLRPISILPALSKVVEHLIKKLILHSCESKISVSQYAFRRNFNTTSLLLNLTDDIRTYVNERKLSVLVSLDLTKAFNSICYSTTIIKLCEKFGFSKSACQLILSFLSGRTQFVDLNGSYSSELVLESGVPQGSVLGPLLFILYINDLFDVLGTSICRPFVFADDIMLLFNTDRDFIDVLENNINFCLRNISAWATENSLAINPLKTKGMLFGSPGLSLPELNVCVSERRIEFVSQHKCLGVIIDNNLKFESHINSLHQKIFFILRRVYSMNIYLPLSIRTRVAKTLMMPLILYGLEVISGTISLNLDKLGRVVNAIVRYVYTVRRREHISEFVKKFLGFSFMEFIKYRNVCFFYKTIKEAAIVQLCNRFCFSRSTRSKQILIPRIRCSTFGRSFSVRIARWWNTLPHELKIFSHTNNVFRLKLARYFLST